VVAVSGFNVTLVAAALAAMAGGLLGRRAGWPLAAVGIVFYTVLVGAPPSAARAALMASIALTAEALGRPRDGLAALLLATALLAGWDPLLLADLGFQLSVLATAGLVLLQPALQARLTRLPAWAAEGLSTTLAAQAFVLPLQLTTFHTLSPVAPLANLLVVPLLPPLMALGLLVAVLGLFAPGLATLVGLLPWAYLELLVRAVRALAAVPFARADVGALAPALGALYVGALLVAVLLAAPEAAALRGRLRPALAAPLPRAAALAVVIAGALSLLAFAGRPEARLRVTVLDVGQGDATLVRTPNGRLLLVDGGPSPAALMAHLGSRLGLAERHIHLVALTHPHEDHVAGLVEVLDRYSVGQVIEGASGYASSGAERWRTLLAQKQVPTLAGASGQQWQLDEDVWLDVYAVPAVPGSRADAQEPAEALVLRLRYGATSLLLPGDLVAEQGKRIVAAGGDLRASALLVPHHGSRFGLDPELLAAVDPTVAAISDGERNRFGHPAPLTLRLLDLQGIPYWRTDRDGTIELTSDGLSWTVQATGKAR
jgi:competence protein ComEC